MFLCVCRCGPDTRVIPRVLQMYHHWLTDDKERSRLHEAGVDTQVTVLYFNNTIYQVVQAYSRIKINLKALH